MHFDTAFVASVVEHMNDDHADACLCIVQAYGQEPQACKAELISFDETHLHFSISVNENTRTISVLLMKQLREEGQIRGVLVAMTKRARQILAERN